MLSCKDSNDGSRHTLRNTVRKWEISKPIFDIFGQLNTWLSSSILEYSLEIPNHITSHHLKERETSDLIIQWQQSLNDNGRHMAGNWDKKMD